MSQPPANRRCIPQACDGGFCCAVCGAGPYKSDSFLRPCKDSSPGAAGKLFSYLKAQVKQLLTGGEVSEETITSRLEVCQSCPKFSGVSCGLCGCACNGQPNHFVNKLALANPDWPVTDGFTCQQIGRFAGTEMVDR